MKETLVKVAGNIITAAVAAGTMIFITKKYMNKINPLIDESTQMMRKSNNYLDIAMKKIEEI